MQAPVFDGIARDLGAVSTRRSFIRLLGGAVALGAVVTVAHAYTLSLHDALPISALWQLKPFTSLSTVRGDRKSVV